ncbi:aminoglycoside phosphotransferase protein [Rutstroemia sp. NJR-2017a BVV2]|nr:aminoglycoside phosphotransferase protein [Rutstroemia sp. NJR-2017a BVV2]
MVKQYGLEWVAETFGLEPRWTSEPDIARVELIARKHLKLQENTPCCVTFYAQGAFNKLYKVETGTGCSLIRITLPVDPSNKTNSEVATINFIRQYTDIPVPQILAFDDSSENELGFEWILMDMLPGATLRTKWRKFSQDVKQDLIKQIAKYQIQLFGYKFPAIGNIFITRENQLRENGLYSTQEVLQERQFSLPILGQLVSMIFFWGDHITQDIPRGPFVNSDNWIRARLTLVLIDQERIIRTSEDEDDIEDAQTAKALAERLLELLPSILPPNDNTTEQSILFHDDLSMQNILVDDNGKLTGIVDWECVSTLPLWRACGFPEFLKGRERNKEPKRDQYAPDDGKKNIDESGENAIDNEGVNSLYWEHLLEFELTILRDLFLKEIGKIAPVWIEEFEKGAVKADFEEAVQNCDNCWRAKQIKTWLDGQEKGENWSLRKRFLE